MFEIVRKRLAKALKVEESAIGLETDLKNDLKADSVAVMGLLFSLEDEYGVIVPDDRIAEMAIVKNLVAFLESEVGKKKKK